MAEVLIEMKGITFINLFALRKKFELRMDNTEAGTWGRFWRGRTLPQAKDRSVRFSSVSSASGGGKEAAMASHEGILTKTCVFAYVSIRNG